jgi:hypothetical protein
LLIVEDLNFLFLYGSVLPEYTFSLFGLIVSISIILASQVAGKFSLQYLDVVLFKKSQIASKNRYAAGTYKLVTLLVIIIYYFPFLLLAAGFCRTTTQYRSSIQHLSSLIETEGRGGGGFEHTTS